MLIYCAHEFGGKPENMIRAGTILKDLQTAHPDHCFISPLHAFSYLPYGAISYEAEMELCFDLLTACDKLLVISGISEGVRREIELANNLGMEVIYYETDVRKNSDFHGCL